MLRDHARIKITGRACRSADDDLDLFAFIEIALGFQLRGKQNDRANNQANRPHQTTSASSSGNSALPTLSARSSPWRPMAAPGRPERGYLESLPRTRTKRAYLSF